MIEPNELNKFKAELNQFIGTSQYYRYFNGILLTDGAKFFFEKLECFWFLDIIATEFVDLPENFQTYTIKVENNEAIITASDGAENIIKTKEISFTDLPDSEWLLYMVKYPSEPKVIMLPSEY